jgi:histidinol-phosphatase (PHP family)
MNPAELPERVSIHGGHSGQFCNHAADSLEDVIQAYIEHRFAWVGITEHIPPLSDRFLYPEEIEQGLDARKIYRRFEQYVSTCRQMQDRYRPQIQIFVGCELEAYAGAIPFARQLIDTFAFDYVVGSLHHVENIGFDYSPKLYRTAVRASGGLEELYCSYFDAQFEMIAAIEPQVVGHFDLIRIFDDAYQQRLALPAVAERVGRNLELIKDLDLTLDFNVRALAKGAAEPYPARSILQQAVEMGISIVPGDDSHGAHEVGVNIDQAIELLLALGVDTNWRRPTAVDIEKASID